MKKFVKNLVKSLCPAFDVLISPLTWCSAIFLKTIRGLGVNRMPVSKSIFNKVGVFPIRDHYYEPMFNPKHLYRALDEDRNLPGIDFNTSEQLKLLNKFKYNDELLALPINKTDNLEFYYHNGAFESGDAEYLYNIVRHCKPKRIIEIGSGNSTLMVVKALQKNSDEDSKYQCEHICIEPYEQSWLEQLNVTVIRKKLEEVELEKFLSLEENDILFIDSSHIIRPQGDVVVEYLELLPIVRGGVFVHIHDIFTPKDYPDAWVIEEVRLWNEQYLLEAFMSCNNSYEIVGALNYLHHNYFEELSAKAPILKQEGKNREPGSFWLRRKNTYEKSEY